MEEMDLKNYKVKLNARADIIVELSVCVKNENEAKAEVWKLIKNGYFQPTDIRKITPYTQKSVDIIELYPRGTMRSTEMDDFAEK